VGGGKKEPIHIQQVRFIKHTQFQGHQSYPTIILLSPESTSSFPHNVQQWPTTIISDFLNHRFILVHFLSLHYLLAAICVRQSIWLWFHPSSVFLIYLYSFFKVFGLPVLTLFLRFHPVGYAICGFNRASLLA
jgi:hypothetical protein